VFELFGFALVQLASIELLRLMLSELNYVFF
jgi:hypothetical protein